jgi:SprT-like family
MKDANDAGRTREYACSEYRKAVCDSSLPLGTDPINQPAGGSVWIAQSTIIAKPIVTPTEQVYLELQVAYSVFNTCLFDGRLPDCVITLQRAAGSYGYFCSQRFVSRDGKQSDEIALNPSHFAARSDAGVLSTLGHEMAHLDQFHFGKPGRAGYHSRAWANLMKTIGLHASATGLPGGRQTGYQMTHYIIKGGPFDVVTARMFGDGFRLSWAEAGSRGGNPPVTAPSSPDESDASNRWKYTCPKCGLNLWGKPNAPAGCWRCMLPMPRSNGKSGGQ